MGRHCLTSDPLAEDVLLAAAGGLESAQAQSGLPHLCRTAFRVPGAEVTNVPQVGLHPLALREVGRGWQLVASPPQTDPLPNFPDSQPTLYGELQTSG